LGPPGTGKTTLSQIIAQESKRPFHILSAINSGVKDIILKSKNRVADCLQPKILFYLLMRFTALVNRSRIPLLAAVEKGWLP
jgi:putative ATPase